MPKKKGKKTVGGKKKKKKGRLMSIPHYYCDMMITITAVRRRVRAVGRIV